jgi:RNA polymerase sigma-70 factor, ECF subfamily
MDSQPRIVPLNDDTIKRAQAGDSEAFAEIFNGNNKKVYALCLRMTRNPTEAEDLTQDAFVQAFRRLSAFRGDSALSTWLYRVAVNTVLMHFRKRVLQQVSLDEPSHRDGKTARRECGRVDGRLSGTVNRIALTRALQRLPSGCRMIFLLHDVHGYEHKEIADMLDCSTGNSKSQLHKARYKLRQTLASTDAAFEPSQTAGSSISTQLQPDT